jgi:hypothetical protein
MDWPPIVFLSAIALAIVVLLVLGFKADENFENDCKSRGGHTVSDTKTVTTWTNGKPGVGTSTTTFCLSSDGRILEIN